MRITLVSPRMSLRPMDSEYKRRLSPSLALLTIAALTPEEHEVTILDENTGDRPGLDGGKARPDLIGITVNIDTSARAYMIAKEYRDAGIPVILGGIHVSANADEALEHADSVCIGEAEAIWTDVLADTAAGNLKPRYFNDTPTDMRLVPRPRWDLLDRARYLYTNITCATRGCPFNCEFCYNSCAYVHHKHRTRPIPEIVAEIEQHGTKHVMFIDDNLIGHADWARDLAMALKPLNLTWHAAVSANVGAYPNLLDAMRDSGCRSLFIGFESINASSLESVGKYQNQADCYEALIGAIHARGMMVNASMVFGLDHDEPIVFRDTLAWLVRNKVETLTSHILTPYPGTRIFKRLRREGRIVDFDWSHYNTANVVFTPAKMSREELYDGYLWMYNQFYSTPNILRRLPDDRRNWLPYLLFNLGYRKFGKVTSLVARMGLMRSVGALARRLSYGIA